MIRRSRSSLVAAVCAAVLWAPCAPAQLPAAMPAQPPAGPPLNPVYADDAPVARETLQRAAEFVAAGNAGRAAHELQRLLDEQGDRVVVMPANADLYVGVRSQVHARLLGDPALLELYRASEEPAARAMLDRGAFRDVERTRLLTPSGFEAALRAAQEDVESARFESARLVLEQLESHPERATEAGRRDAASMLVLVARYLDRPDVWARAERWRLEAGDPLRERPAPFPRPPAVRVPALGMERAGGTPSPEAVPARPLWSTRLEPEPLPDREPDAPPEQVVENLWVFPRVVGDTIYINDGTFVTARDRYTLQARWSVHPVGEGGAEDTYAARRQAAAHSAGRQAQDVNSVSVHGRTLVTTMGLAMGGSREGAPLTLAIDADTGRVLWSVDVARLDPSLDGASVRGAALIDPIEGGSVVLLARKPAQGRRTVALYMLSLGLESGELRWVRPIASAGSIPWSQADRRIGWSGVLHEGVVYAVDPLGVIAAVEAASGRVRWVRAAPVPAMMAQGSSDSSMPWQWGEPIVHAGALVTLSPDRSQVLRIDLGTGAIGARRDAAELGEPLYLLRADDRLVCVGADSVTTIPLDAVAEGVVRPVVHASRGEVRGRVMVSGGDLLVPKNEGLAIVPLDGGTTRLLRLEHSGNILPLADQVLALDAISVHSYLNWEVADRLLTRRMSDEPDNPEPAVTAVQLAFHAGHAERIAPSADAALRAIEKDPSRPAHEQERQRLFRVLAEMIEGSQARWGADATRKGPEGAPMLDLPWMGEAIVRLGRAARTPGERVTHLLALGRYQDGAGKGALAAEAYQRVLAEPALADATVRAGMVTVRADLEATRRIRQLVQEQGPEPYAGFSREAEERLGALAPGTGEELETLARAFPAAPAACGAWVRLAELHEAGGRPHAALSALREAMDVAEVVRDPGPRGVPLGEIVGRLVEALRAQDRAFTAAQLLARVREQSPGIALTSHGRPIDDGAMLASLRARLLTLQRLPRIGSQLRGEPQPVQDWAIMPAQSRANVGRACEQVMMISPRNERVALWGGSSGGGGLMEPLWSRPTHTGTPVLLRYDAQNVDLIWDRLPEHAPAELREKRDASGDGPVLERIGALDGKTRWFTPPLSTLMRGAEGDGGVRREGLVVVFAEQSVVLLDRSGRAACLDADSGRVLWARKLPLRVVIDAVAGGGVVAVGGSFSEPGRDRNLTSGLLVLDARTGEVQQKIEQARTLVRWVRLAGVEGNAAGESGPGRAAALAVIVGYNNAIASIDPASGRTNWTITPQGGAALAMSMEAWIFGERLFLLDSARSLWLVPVATGQAPARPLDLGERLSGSAQIEATALPNGRVAFSSERGVCVLDASGKLIGADALSSPQEPATMIPPMPAAGAFVAVESTGHEGEVGYRLSVLEGRSGALRSTRLLGGLELPPRRAAVIDGRIVVTAGPNTVVYPAPEGER